MNKLIKQLEKATPFFKKIANNKFLSAVMTGFMDNMPLVLFSSIFMLIINVPNTCGFYWSEGVTTALNRPYDLSMGLLGLFTTSGIARAYTGNLNQDLDSDKKVDPTAASVAAMVSFLLVAANPLEGGITTNNLGSAGIFAAMIVAFIFPQVYNFANVRNIRITLPDAVPPNVARGFDSVISFGLSVGLIWAFDLFFRQLVGLDVSTALMGWLAPLFQVGNSYWGVAIVFGAVSILTFIGLHGTSIVLSVISPLMMVNLAENQAMYSAGEVPTNAFAPGLMTAALMGGSGA